MSTKAVERDPRIDPQSGDVVRKGKRQRKVIGVGEWRGPWVNYQTPTDEKEGVVHALRLPLWQEWAKGAAVLRYLPTVGNKVLTAHYHKAKYEAGKRVDECAECGELPTHPAHKRVPGPPDPPRPKGDHPVA